MQGHIVLRIIRLKEVVSSTGLARSAIYKYMAERSFPRSVPIGRRCVGWIESEVHNWILARAKEHGLAEYIWYCVQCALLRHEPYQLSYRIRCVDGQIKEVWEKGVGIYAASGEVLGGEGAIFEVRG